MNDVFPRRNLNPEAEEWGREVERRIQQAENREMGTTQSVSGLNRASAANFESLAEQLRLLDLQVQRVDDLYGALPKGDQETSVVSNFALTSGWNTVTYVTFYPERAGIMDVSVTAHGQLRSGSTSTNMQAQIRVSVHPGTFQASPAMPGLAATPDGTWINNMMIGYGWTVAVDPNIPVNVAVQVFPTDPASWGSGTGSMMTLTAFATFTSPPTTS